MTGVLGIGGFFFDRKIWRRSLDGTLIIWALLKLQWTTGFRVGASRAAPPFLRHSSQDTTTAGGRSRRPTTGPANGEKIHAPTLSLPAALPPP